MTDDANALRCPMCERAVARDGAAFPFCSPRCRLLDLDRWFSGAYTISRPLDARDAEELEASREGRPPGEADDADGEEP